MSRFLIRPIPMLLSVAVLLATPLSLRAGEVSLTGEGSVQYTPDSARLQFTATAEAVDADLASKQVDARIAKWEQAIAPIRKQLNDYSDAALSLYTRTLSASDRDAEPGQTVVATQSVSLTIDDLSLLNPLIRAARDAGLEFRLGSRQFYHSAEDALQQQALAQAIADARRQCRFVAKQLDVTCGAVKSININGGRRPSPMMMAEARSPKGPVSDVGPQEIKASVSATFELN